MEAEAFLPDAAPIKVTSRVEGDVVVFRLVMRGREPVELARVLLRHLERDPRIFELLKEGFSRYLKALLDEIAETLREEHGLILEVCEMIDLPAWAGERPKGSV